MEQARINAANRNDGDGGTTIIMQNPAPQPQPAYQPAYQPQPAYGAPAAPMYQPQPNYGGGQPGYYPATPVM